MSADQQKPSFSVRSISEITHLSPAAVRRRLEGVPGTKVGRSVQYPQDAVKARFLTPSQQTPPETDNERKFWHAIGGIQSHGPRR